VCGAVPIPDENNGRDCPVQTQTMTDEINPQNDLLTSIDNAKKRI